MSRPRIHRATRKHEHDCRSNRNGPGHRAEATKKGKTGARSAHVATKKGKVAKKATPAKKAPKAKEEAKVEKPVAHEGSRKAEILALMQRPTGATLSDLMKATGWQVHSVRGFISERSERRWG